MTYTINKTNGEILATIPDGQVDTSSSSIKLLGKNATNYGELFAENFIHMLENFAKTSAPTNPQIGQLWYHIDANGSNNHKLKICRGINDGVVDWIVVNGISKDIPNTETGSGRPVSPDTGEMYWDGNQLWVYNENATSFNAGWELIGPLSPKEKETEVKHETITTTAGGEYEVIALNINGKTVGIFSSANTPFSTLSATIADGNSITDLGKFPTISGGLNISTDYASSTPYVPLNASSTPTGNELFDLGSSVLKWKNFYCKSVQLSTIKTGDTFGDWSGDISIKNFLRTDIDNIPFVSSEYSLGSETNTWNAVYADTAYFDNMKTSTGVVSTDTIAFLDRNIVPSNGIRLGNTDNNFSHIYGLTAHIDNITIGVNSDVEVGVEKLVRTDTNYIPDVNAEINIGSDEFKINKLTSVDVDTSSLTVTTINDSDSTALMFSDSVTERTNQHYFTTVVDRTTTPLWDLDTKEIMRLELSAHTTLANPINMKDGGKYTLMISQGGNYTFSFPTSQSIFKFEDTTPETPSTGKMLILEFISDGTYMYCINEKTF